MPEDMLCVMYIRGVRSNELREKLLEVAEPSLVRFNRIVDSFDQAKSQMAEIRKTPTSRSISIIHAARPTTGEVNHASIRENQTPAKQPR